MCLARDARRDLEARHAALQPQLLKRAATLQAKGGPHDPALHRFLSTPISGAPCAKYPNHLAFLVAMQRPVLWYRSLGSLLRRLHGVLVLACS